MAVAPTIMGNKEKQNKIAYCAACFVNNLLRFLSLSLSLSRRWSQTFYALRLRARAQRNIRQRNCNDAEWKSESKKTATEINKCISQLRVLRLTGWLAHAASSCIVALCGPWGGWPTPTRTRTPTGRLARAARRPLAKGS